MKIVIGEVSKAYWNTEYTESLSVQLYVCELIMGKIRNAISQN